MYEYEKNHMDNIHLYKFDSIKLDVYRSHEDNTTSTTYLCLLTKRIVFQHTGE